MLARFRPVVVLFAFALCGIGMAPETPVAPEIRDDGKFFSAEAIKKADARIREIARKYERDLLIETFATVPRDDEEKVKAMDAKARADYFLQWAKKRVQDRVVNGAYVLICKEPRWLRVGVVEREPHKFPPGSSASLEKVIAKEFAQGQFDDGLDQAVRWVEEKLAKAK